MNQTRRLAAILTGADVVGYSRLMGSDEEGTLEHLKALRRWLLDPKVAEHHGRIVKNNGEGLRKAGMPFQYRIDGWPVRNLVVRQGGRVAPGLSDVTGAEFGPAQAKPSMVRCSCQPSGRRECASSLSVVRSGG